MCKYYVGVEYILCDFCKYFENGVVGLVFVVVVDGFELVKIEYEYGDGLVVVNMFD